MKNFHVFSTRAEAGFLKNTNTSKKYKQIVSLYRFGTNKSESYHYVEVLCQFSGAEITFGSNNLEKKEDN